MATSGIESILASASPVTRFSAPGPEVAITTPGLPRGPGVALGREDAPLLVPRQDRPDPVAIARQRLVHRHARAARIGEDDLDTVPHQRLDQDVGPGDRLGSSPGRRLTIIDGGHGSSSLARPTCG